MLLFAKLSKDTGYLNMYLNMFMNMDLYLYGSASACQGWLPHLAFAAFLEVLDRLIACSLSACRLLKIHSSLTRQLNLSIFLALCHCLGVIFKTPGTFSSSLIHLHSSTQVSNSIFQKTPNVAISQSRVSQRISFAKTGKKGSLVSIFIIIFHHVLLQVLIHVFLPVAHHSPYFNVGHPCSLASVVLKSLGAKAIDQLHFFIGEQFVVINFQWNHKTYLILLHKKLKLFKKIFPYTLLCVVFVIEQETNLIEVEFFFLLKLNSFSY